MVSKETVLTVGVSSRALFELEYEHIIYENSGIETYINYQIANEEVILKPGVAFNLVKNLLKLNDKAELKDKRIEIIIMSRSCPDISIRIFNSIRHYELDITRGIFTGGEPLANYVKTNNIDLYLSTNEEDVRQVIKSGIAAAKIYNTGKEYCNENKELRIAFDFDCVLASVESENIYQENGLLAFEQNEMKLKNVPVSDGPFKSFACKIGEIQKIFNYDKTPIRVAICTARNYPAHERVIKSLRSWGIRVNEAYFLGGYDKSRALEAFNADIFFDDQEKNVTEAAVVVPSCQVL